jgi:RNA polymerase sigma-70 factor (sigma-B/F/G subfamily)
MAVSPHVHTIDGVALVVVDGVVDLARAARFRATVRDAIDSGAAEVVVDLSRVTLLDAAAVGILMRQAARAEELGVVLRVHGAKGVVLEVLEVLGVAKRLGAYDFDGTGEATGSSPVCPARPMARCCRPDLDRQREPEPAEAAPDGPSSAGFPNEAVHALLAQAMALPPGDPYAAVLRREAAELARPAALRLARRYSGIGESTDDLAQVAALGLVKAINGYEPQRDCGFSSYAIPTILGELRRHFRDKGSVIRSPRWVQELRLSMRAVAPDLTQRLGREPTTADYATALNQPSAAIEEVQAAAERYRPQSLSAVAGHTGVQLHDLIGAADAGFDRVEYHQALHEILPKLPLRLRRILALRFYGNKTQAEIAQDLGLSQMHVSRLLRQALNILKAYLNGTPTHHSS